MLKDSLFKWWLSVILIVSGGYCIVNSVDIGSKKATNYTAGEGIDTSVYLVVLKGYQQSYLVLGSILLIVGFCTFIFLFFMKGRK
ncbi:hypothetical protein BK726_08650 [Bacillus thuringiensis serovar londrina]|uniref:hypothetical protein n=1 Tax=Bacillus cereus group TaxID=86661 RepID=UPI00065BEBE4|nr:MULTISPECIES: hypothetical protein [Bacillus cereus group]KMP33914.1 hypothetical protein TU54_21695 [Bacillus cereus]OTX93005.1 hypothetical protein BK726_08650 [Bacillus thuringiensis serovar londrina]WIV92297.1 hypothetical protein QNH49_23600 [Bacillus bombysepticus]